MRKRIEWTEFEQSTVYSATVDLLKDRKAELPISTSKARLVFLQAVRDAQVALPENRRRKYILAVENITGDLRQRFIDNGILPRDLESLKVRRGKAKEAQVEEVRDPRDDRIVELTGQIDDAQRLLGEKDGLIETLRGRIVVLESQPTPLALMQNFIADTIALAFQKVGDAQKPHGVRMPATFHKAPPGVERDDPSPDAIIEKRKEDLPAFERERRKDPQYLSGNSEEMRLPKITVIGGGVAGKRHAAPLPQAFLGKARVTVYDEENIQVAKEKARNADMTFMLMGACSHSMVEGIISVTDHYQRVANYNYEHLKNLINNWLEKEWSATAKA